MEIKNIFLLSAVVGIVLSACNGGSSSSNASIQYMPLNYSGPLESAGGDTGLTGIRQAGTSSNVYITGSYVVNNYSNGTLYVGPITGGGTYYVYNYPSTQGAKTSGTNVYSADNGINDNVLLTGTYTTQQSGESHAFGFYYNGPVANNNQLTDFWQTLVYPESNVSNTYPHSIMGGLIVGNYLSVTTAGTGFIYNIAKNSYRKVVYPDAKYTSIYGIWANGGESYTIAGGYSSFASNQSTYGFIADYNRATDTLSNWTSYTFNNQPGGVTHFEGITSDGNGGYNLAAGAAESSSISVAFVNVKRITNGNFNPTATWVSVWYPNSKTTTADTVYQNYLLGVYTESAVPGLFGYVANIPGGFFQ